MLLERYGRYLLKGRWQAALNALIWTLLPFMNWLGVVIVNFVTLRQGTQNGMVVLLWTAMPPLAAAVAGYPNWLIWGVLSGSLVSWLMAVLLRECRSWQLVLQLAVALAALIVLAIHFFVPHIETYWQKVLTSYSKEMSSIWGIEPSSETFKTFIALLAKMATGWYALTLLFINLTNLLIARWWQASLFNPGGLAQELSQLRLGWAPLGLFIAILGGCALDLAIAWDVLALICGLFFLAGLSLFHYLAKMTQVMWLLVLGFYLLLLFLSPYVVPVVILLAIMDTLGDVRQRVQQKT
jgi:hypothetical protein